MKNIYHYCLFALLLACTTLWPVCASNEAVECKETTLKDWQNQRQEELKALSKALDKQTFASYGVMLDKDVIQEVMGFVFPTYNKPLLWDEFVARYQAGERFFDLCYIDLTEKNSDSYISDKNLVNGKRFEYEDVNFTKSFFQGDLVSLVFKNCCFKQVIMNDIDARMAYFTACNLQGAELNRGNFNDSAITNSNCKQIQCIEGNMKGAMLINTSFEKSNLSAIYFYECQEFSELNFKNSCLVNAIINAGEIKNKNIDFTQADCSGATLYDITAENVIFDQTKLIKAKINSKYFLGLKNCLFKNCDLTQADLRIPTDTSYTTFWKNKTISAEKDTFAGSWLEGADLSQLVNLDMQTLAHAYLLDAKLSSADKKRVSLRLKYQKHKLAIGSISMVIGSAIYLTYRLYTRRFNQSSLV